MDIAKWIEHFIIIPGRWYKLHVRDWYLLQQRCKVCGCRDKFDFHVPDHIWENIIPEKYQNKVVCLACFDDFASKRKVDYSTSIQMLYFAGNNIAIKFK